MNKPTLLSVGIHKEFFDLKKEELKNVDKVITKSLSLEAGFLYHAIIWNEQVYKFC